MTDAPIPENVDTIAIVCPTWLGDTVMATPVYRAVRAARPHARLVAFVRAPFDTLLTPGPWFDAVVPIAPHGTGLFAAARAVRSAQPDAVLLLPNSWRSAVVAALTRTRRRIGRRRDGRQVLLTHAWAPTPEPTPRSTVDDYADLGAFALGHAIDDRTLALEVDEAARSAVAQRIPEDAIAFVPGGVRPAKRWPTARFAQLATALAREHDATIVLSGSPAERPILDAIAKETTAPIINLAEESLPFGHLPAVFDRVRLLVTNDTGPRHIAAAIGCPIVSLFGPTDHRYTTLPGVREHCLLAQPFLPEDLIADRLPAACSIDRISVGDVRAAVAALLDEAPGRDRTPRATLPG